MSELEPNAPLASGEEFSELNLTNVCGLETAQNSELSVKQCQSSPPSLNVDANFKDTFSDSLEDLVNSFDENLTKCFHNYNNDEDTVSRLSLNLSERSKEDIVSESQILLSLTPSYGHVLSGGDRLETNRQSSIASLVCNVKVNDNHSQCNKLHLNGYTNHKLDANNDQLSGLVAASLQHESFTVEQVLAEIEEIMQKILPSKISSSILSNSKSDLIGARSYRCKNQLQSMSLHNLNELYHDLEKLIQVFSETLIEELAFRDELEFEKESRSTFISLLLNIQNMRRQQKVFLQKGDKINANNGPKYLTTVIPYNPSKGPPDINTLQILIKILKAMTDNSPTVPTLLTDFILRVVCPT